MAGKLSARRVETAKGPGRFSDGDGLYLLVSKTGAKSWAFYFHWQGKRREMGLGRAGESHISLAEARHKATEARQQVLAGNDPIRERELKSQTDRPKKSFGSFADEYVALHRTKFRNKKHASQWQATLGATYCSGIRSLPIDEVNTEAVLKVLRPIWQTIPETASRIRGRIEKVIDAAKAQGYFQGDNPARWKGHLKSVLPARQKLSRGHHAALPYDEMPAFMAELRSKINSTAALALEFCILTAARTTEALGASWDEFDLNRGVWTIPRERMKAGHEHRIPLPPRALEILKTMEIGRLPHNQHVFPGHVGAKGMSNMAMAAVLKRMKRENITVHGFRSTFRDWAAEQTSFPHETCEHALAHRISDKAEAAYRRGDQFEKRRKLMDAWAVFCDPKSTGNVAMFKQAG